MKNYNVIWASARNRVIGSSKSKGGLPWKLKQDMAFFKNTTKFYNREDPDSQNAVVFGRKTWEAMGKRTLPNRFNIVMSRSSTSSLNLPKGVLHVRDFEELPFLCEQYPDMNEVFIAGGAQIYSLASEHQDKVKNVFKTRIGCDIEGDIKLDKDLFEDFRLLEISKTLSDKGINYDFTRWVNPRLYPLHFDEYSRSVFSSEHEELQYQKLIERVMNEGSLKGDRTQTGVYSTFGNMMRFDLSQSFPLLTTKRVFWKGVVEELLWFFRGSTDSKKLSDKGVRIWDGNGSRDFLDKNGFPERREGDLGPVYGFQWRHSGAEYVDADTNYSGQGIDQLRQVIEQIKTNPESRRLIVNSWNVKDISNMALPPCHILFQFFVDGDRLSCLLYQRSCDLGLGVPFNIASYALLICLVAKETGLQPGEFVHILGDSHVYTNHVEALREQNTRKPNPFPVLNINHTPGKNFEDYKLEDFELSGYHPFKTIKMEMAV